MMKYMQKAFAYDIHIRRDVDERFSPEGIRVVSHDISQGTVYERNGVKVTAFLVDHGPVKPAFGYRVDYAGHSVVLSGDTRPSDNLVRFSQGTDVVLHEVLDADELRSRATHQTEQQRARIIAHHSTPEEAGTIFTRIKPKLAVYYHNIGTERILQKTRLTYSGPLELSEDLMTINVGDEVTVQRPNSSGGK
jgi:ribonuclease Z